MAGFVDQQWVLSERFDAAGKPAQMLIPYRAYMPDLLQARSHDLEPNVHSVAMQAGHLIAKAEADVSTSPRLTELAGRAIGVEALASSQIDGVAVSEARLIDAIAAQRAGEPARDRTARDVVALVDALSFAARWPAEPIRVATLRTVHAYLLRGGEPGPTLADIRAKPKWIGGTPDDPRGAFFVPPPPEALPRLLDDLCDFCNDDALPVVAQAAIAHAQFETIHPFPSGNGRTGRVLVALILRRRGFARYILPPFSMILAVQPKDYEHALHATRYVAGPQAAEARRSTVELIDLFAGAFSEAAGEIAYL